MKILFIDTVHPILNEGLNSAGHQCIDGSEMNEKELILQLAQCEGIVVRSRIRIDKKIMEAAPGLKFIARAGAGMENIDALEADKRKIVCLNAPEGNRDAVAEHAIGMLLSLMNRINLADAQVRQGIWRREENRGHELMNKTVGIIGFGNTGRALAKKLGGFDCRILAYDKYISAFSDDHVAEASIEKILQEADVLSLHVPLTAETEYMLNKSFLEKFKKNIFLINTSRGKCLSLDDLVSLLKSGKIQGACLDVLEYEDSSFEKFDLSSAKYSNNESWNYLRHSERVILTPHVAGWTFESHRKISEVLLEKIMALNL